MNSKNTEPFKLFSLNENEHFFNGSLTVLKSFLMEGIWFTVFSVLFFNLFFISNLHAEPTGGIITGGSGSISHANSITNVQQNTTLLSIDWNNCNLNSHEIINFMQPGASSIASNRISSNTGLKINGRINTSMT